MGGRAWRSLGDSALDRVYAWLEEEPAPSPAPPPVANLPFCWVVQRWTDAWVARKRLGCGKPGREAPGKGGEGG